jgi:hypothetical protein
MKHLSMLPVIPALVAAFTFGAPALRAEKGHDHGEQGKHDHAGHDHGKHEHAGHEHAAPDTTGPVLGAREGLASLRKHLGEMEQELAASRAEGFHAHDDAVQAAVRGLDRDSTLAADKRKRVQGYVKNVRRLVHKIHHQAEGKKFDTAKKELAKLKAQVDLLEKQFAPSAVAPAPAKP